jgi:hypothetical protein
MADKMPLLLVGSFPDPYRPDTLAGLQDVARAAARLGLTVINFTDLAERIESSTCRKGDIKDRQMRIEARVQWIEAVLVEAFKGTSP